MHPTSNRSSAQARSAHRAQPRTPISVDGWSRLGETIVRMAKAAAAMHAAESARPGRSGAPRLEVRA